MDVLNYQCPNCGAPLKFSSQTQRWDCEFCQSSFTAEQLQAMEQAKTDGREKAAPEETGPSGEEGQGKVYSCPNCGAEMITEGNTAATFCAFCGSPAVFPKQLSGEFSPEKLIPFRLTKEQAVEALQKLCKSKPLLPRDFSDRNHIEKVTGIYVPFWLFDCSMSVRLDAMAQRVQTWSDSHYRYTKTDHYRLEREGDLEVRGVPTDGLQRMSDDMMDALEPFDYSSLCDFQMSYLSGYFAERYDVDKEASWPRAQARIERSARALTEQTLHGYLSCQTTNFQTSVFNKESHYAMLPVWLLSTQYKGKNYLFAMNGQTGKMVGKLPLSYAQLAKWFGICGGLGFLLTLIGGLLL